MGKFLKSGLLTPILIVLAVFLGSALVGLYSQYRQVAVEAVRTSNQLEELQLQKIAAEDYREGVNDPEYIQLKAKEKLNYLLPGEKVVFIANTATDASLPSPLISNETSDGRNWKDVLNFVKFWQ